jgi:hypothetical protein
MDSLTIPIPEALRPFAPQLRFFLDTMVTKLNINRHKGFADDSDFGTLMGLLKAEMDELNQALATESQFETAIEAADLANFCFLIASRCLMLDKLTWQKEQKAGAQHGNP